MSFPTLSLKRFSLSGLLLVTGVFNAYANPQGATVAAGSAIFNSSTPNTFIVTTGSDKTIINYNTFSIASNEAAVFKQPNAGSAVLNRVIGLDPSLIYGTLSSNGKLFLVNPNGIIFGAGSRVNAPALVASTLDIADNDFLNGKYNFFKSGSNAFIINYGRIAAQPGGYIALLSQAVNNQGVILGDYGSIALASGNKMTLALDSQGQISIAVDDAVAEEVHGPDGRPIREAVTNAGTIQANGGKVALTAQLINDVFDYAVNNTGIVEAHAIGNTGGIVTLVASGDIYSSGTLESSSLVERGNTLHVGGIFNPGTADIENADNALIFSTNATISGKIKDTANIIVNPNVVLTLGADTGLTAGGALAMDPSSVINGQAYDLSITAGHNSALGNINNVGLLTLSSGSGLPVTFTSSPSSTFQVNTLKTNNLAIFSRSIGSGTAVDPIIIYSDSNAPGGLEYITASGLGLYYSQAGNIDASETSKWNGGQGFVPIGTDLLPFTGSYNGNSQTISGLYINLPSGNGVGLFGYSSQTARISNTGISKGIIMGGNNVGAIVGENQGAIVNSYNAATVSASSYVGGLTGWNFLGSISGSYNAGKVSGNYAGGLAGRNYGFITDSYNKGSISGTNVVGGLVGYNIVQVLNSYNDGPVSGNSKVGGLAGWNNGLITMSYNTMNITGSNEIGGLAGFNDGENGFITGSYNTGNISGNNEVGGLAGDSGNEGSIASSYNTGAVSGDQYVGGLVGQNGGSINLSYNNGNVSGKNDDIGGLIGESFRGFIGGSYNTGKVSGKNYVGGLSGFNESDDGTTSGSYNTGNVTGSGDFVGGLVGDNRGPINSSYNLGNVKAGGQAVGGLAGENDGALYFSPINNSYSTGNVSGNGQYIGGLVGWRNGTYLGPISNSYYNIDTVFINGSHLVTAGGIYNGEFQDWINHSFALNAGNYFSQDGTGDYLVNNLNDLKNLLGFSQVGSLKFLLGSNIDLQSLPGFFIPVFAAQFDGNGMTISNLNVNLKNDNLGLFGINTGLISNIGLINSSVNGMNNIGGLVGVNNGTIAGSYNIGKVYGSGSGIGGLAGISNNGVITNSHAGGSVSGGSYVGGITGEIGYILSDSYSMANVSGNLAVGGLVGGGSFFITNSYYDLEHVLINGGHRVGAGALYDNQYQDWFTHNMSLNISNYFSQSLGYYTVNNLSDLKNLLGFSNGPYKFILNSNIDLKSLPGFYIPSFSAIEFNGNGHVISDLNLNFKDEDLLGFFGVISFGAVIDNLGLVNVNITGHDLVGSLAGENHQAYVITSYASGKISSNGEVIGGLVGSNEGTIADSYNTVDIQGKGLDVGGLAGLNDGSISNSYSTGSIAGMTNVGGLVGDNLGIVTHSYSTGHVSGSTNVGGLAGYNLNNTIINCAWWRGSAANAIGYDVPSGGTLATLASAGYGTDESLKAAFFSTSEPVYALGTASGWDFTNVWSMPPNGYPLLQI